MIQSVLSQLTFSFYRHQPIRADFSGGQITSDAGLLPLRAFDQRHHLTCDWGAGLSDPRQHDRLRHDSLALLRQITVGPIENIEEAITVRLQQKMADLAVVFKIHEHRRFIRVIVIYVVRGELEMPFYFSGIGVNGENAGGVKVVAGPVVTDKIGCRIARRPIQGIEFWIIGTGHPCRAPSV